MLLELIALSACCLLVGLLLGIVLANHRGRRYEAPLPDFDPMNPINGQARTETHGGVEWMVYGGRR